MDCKPLNELERDTFEIVPSYELKEVFAKDLKCQDQMLSESEGMVVLHDVSNVVGIGAIQHLDQVILDKALLVQPFLVLKSL